ncbi:amino acid ABC transporter substrate-binding protein [Tenacibaculum amylolyticum]|uniref:amino acid ABC transporter substrate-binding protein n=1 Tax=Tenacibaculum amylolyticum TaxID=104269 RepID=UPI00389383F1
MNKLKFLAFTLVIALIVSCSQQKRYISYRVQEGETMQDIAKRINVPAEDLVRLNPDVGETLSSNSVIIIPNPEFKKTIPLIQNPTKGTNTTDTSSEGNETNETSTPSTNDDSTEVKADSMQVVRTVYEYKTHVVQPGETVYRLTKMYNISKDELLKLNPEFPKLRDNLLSVGQELKVKVEEKKIVYISREEDLKNHVTHIVKPKETVYSLTRFYNISKDDLLKLNPEYPDLVDDKLSIGQILRIRPIEEKLASDDVTFYIDTIAEVSEPIKLALLLPFKAAAYDSIPAEKIFNKVKSKSAGSANLANIITDFYFGAEMAIDSISKNGVNVDVAVFDTGSRGKLVQQILDEDKLDDVDVIIGPFYSDKVELVADDVNAPVVFPHFSKAQGEFSSSKIVKSAPDKETHSNALVSYLNEIYNGETIFVVGDGKKQSDEQVEFIASNLKKNDSIQDIHILKPEKGYIKKERFTEKMKPNSHSWIILTSDDKSAIANAINSMVVLPEDVTAHVFAIDKNKAYDEVNNNTLARVDFTYVTDHFSQEKDENVKRFVKQYRARNKDIPSEYAIRGFDLTYDILMRLASGEKLSQTFKQGISMRLKNKFDYNKKLFGSTRNRGLFIVKYNKDLSLERLK